MTSGRDRRRLSRLATLMVTVAVSVPASTSAEREAVTPGSVLAAMNEHRERRGLPPLQRNARLDAAAADRLRDMFEQGYFDHVAPDGTQPFFWARHRGYTYAALGENLATGQRGSRDVVDQWMSSPGHRANILGDFEDAGIAIALGSPAAGYEGYTFVAMYGRAGGRLTLRSRR